MLDSTTIRLLAPAIILQLVVQVIALLDLRKRQHVLGGNKILWAVIILLFQILGPLVYFTIGRKDT